MSDATAETGADSGLDAENEAALAVLWAERRLRGLLTTVSGRRLEVVYPGRPAPGWGPDFRGAYLVLDGTPLQGDVEVHLRTSGFRDHGHGGDPAYDSLALHVVLRHDGALPWTPTRCGRRVEILELAGHVLAESSARHALLLGEPLPCGRAGEKLGAAEVRRRLAGMALRRLRASTVRFEREAAAEGREQALYARLLEGLGYQENRQPMRALASALPLAVLLERAGPAGPRRPEDLASLLLEGAVGLPWRLQRLRPAASPFLRLRAAGALLDRLWAGEQASEALALAEGRDLVRLLTVPGGCGRGRAIELAVNALLPYLAGGGEEERAERLLAALPGPGRYGGLRHLYTGLPAEACRGAIAVQGLLDLDKNYCRKGKCGACPMS